MDTNYGNRTNLEIFLDYLQSSDLKADLFYIAMIIVLVILLVVVLIAFKKFGIYDSIIDVIRVIFGKEPISVSKVEKAKQEVKEGKTKIVYVEKPIVKQIRTLQDLEHSSSIQNLHEYANVCLSSTEINTIKRLKAEKKRLKDQIDQLKESNSDLSKQLSVTNKELEILKINKHPDLILFGHFLESLKTYLSNYFKNIIEINHLIDKQDNTVFSEYVYKIFNETKEHVHGLIVNFDGVLIENLYQVMDKVTFTRMLITEEETLLNKLRAIAIEHHEKSRESLKKRNAWISKSLNDVLKKNNQAIINELKNDVQIINSPKLLENLIKKFPSDDFFILVSNVEIDAIEAHESIRISQKEQQLKEANEFVEYFALQIESKYKEKLIMEIFQQIQLGSKEREKKTTKEK